MAADNVILVGGLSSSLTLFAAAEELSNPWVNWSAMGVLAFVVVFVFTKLIPDLLTRISAAEQRVSDTAEKHATDWKTAQEIHRAEKVEIVAEHRKGLDRVAESIGEMADSIHEMVAHCKAINRTTTDIPIQSAPHTVHVERSE